MKLLGGRRAGAEDAVEPNLDVVTFGGRKEKSNVAPSVPKHVTALNSSRKPVKSHGAAIESSRKKKTAVHEADGRVKASDRQRRSSSQTRRRRDKTKSPERRCKTTDDYSRGRSRSASSHRSSARLHHSVDKSPNRTKSEQSSNTRCGRTQSRSKPQRQPASKSPSRKAKTPSQARSRDKTFALKSAEVISALEHTGHHRRSKSPSSKPSMASSRRASPDGKSTKRRQTSSQSKSRSRSQSPSSKKSFASKPTVDSKRSKSKKLDHRDVEAAAQGTRSKSKSDKTKRPKSASTSDPPRTIDRVPTAMGYNSDDSVEALLEERSRYSRYSIDEERIEPTTDNETEDEKELPESRTDDKYSRGNYGALESLWSESTDDAPRWSDERNEQEVSDPRIKRKVNEIAVSYSIGEVTGDITFPSAIDIESEWSKSIVLENDSESVNADPIYTKPDKTRKAQRSVGSRTKKYDVKAQADVQKKLNQKQKTQKRQHARAKTSNEDLTNHHAPNEKPQSNLTTPAPEKSVDVTAQSAVDIASSADSNIGKTKETSNGPIDAVKQYESSPVGTALPAVDSGEAQKTTAQEMASDNTSHSVATFFIRGFASLAKAANASSPITYAATNVAHETKNPDEAPVSETPESQQRNRTTHGDGGDTILIDRANSAENPIAHVHTTTEDEVELAWNELAIRSPTTAATDVTKVDELTLVDSSDEDESDDESSSDDETNLDVSETIHEDKAVETTAYSQSKHPQRFEEPSRAPKSQGIMLRALKAFRKPQSDIPKDPEECEVSSSVHVAESNQRNVSKRMEREKRDTLEARDLMLSDAKKKSSGGKSASEEIRVDKSAPSRRVRNNAEPESFEKSPASAIGSKCNDGLTRKKGTASKTKLRDSASSAVKSKKTKKSAVKSKTKDKQQPKPQRRQKDEPEPRRRKARDEIEGNRSLVSEASLESFDPILKRRSQVTKSTVSTTPRSSKHSKKMKMPKLSLSTATKSGPPSVQLSEGEKLTMYSKSLMTEDSDESADPKKVQGITPRIRKNHRKKLAAEMTQLDEYEQRQSIALDEPQLVQCLKYYYCGAAASAAGTAITTVDCTPKSYRTHDGAVDDMIMEQRMDDDDREFSLEPNEIRDDDVLKVETSESLEEAPEIALPRTPSVVMEVTGMKLHLDDDSEANRRDAAALRAHEKADSDAVSITSIEFMTSASSGVLSAKSGAESVVSYESGDDDEGSICESNLMPKKKGLFRGLLKRIGRN